MDGAGNVYVADRSNNTIRKISGGAVTTFAGSAQFPGSAGYLDGTGSAARFYGPTGVAVDSAGNVYVADSFNNAIRKISPGGVVTTLAGLGGTGGSTDGTGSSARFHQPLGVAVDSAGNVYVGDSLNSTIRKISPAGVVSTLAGLANSPGGVDGTGSSARFYSPSGVAVDNAGTVYVADDPFSIRKISPAGVVTTLAGLYQNIGSADGVGSAARFNSPRGVAVDAAGRVYVADTNNSTIRRITPSGAVTTLAGVPQQTGLIDGAGSDARFRFPQGVALDKSGYIYVADTADNAIRAGVSPAAPTPSPSPTPVAPPHGGLSTTIFTVNESSSPGTNLANSVLRFAAQQTGKAAGLVVRVQSSTTPTIESSWTDLPNGSNGYMTWHPGSSRFVLNTTNYPLSSSVFFRSISSAPGYFDSVSNIIGPFNLANGSAVHLGPTVLFLAANGPGQEIKFRATETAPPAGVVLRIQASTNPGSEASWADLNDGNAGHMLPYSDPTRFYLDSQKYPEGAAVFFRAVASAGGYVDSLSNAIGVMNVVNGPAPGVNILPPADQPGSGTGLSSDDPLIVSLGNIHLGAIVSATNGQAIKKLALLYDGAQLDQRSGGETVLNLDYQTSVPGDHVIKALATDERGITGYADPVYIRILPTGGKLFRMIGNGSWSDGKNWQDGQGNNGVPGANDFAIIKGTNATITQSVSVFAISLLSGSISGAGGELTVTGFMSVAGGQLGDVNLTIGPQATMSLIGDQDVPLSGTVTNYGKIRLTGRGGIVPVTSGTGFALRDNRDPAIKAGFFDGVAAFFKNLGAMIFHRPNVKPKAASVPPVPPPVPQARGVTVAAMEGSGQIVSEKGTGVVNAGSGSLIGQDGTSLISEAGSGIVATDGATLIGQDGTSLISQDGGSVIAGRIVGQDGTSLIGQDGTSLIGNDGTSLRIQNSGAGAAGVKAATAASGFTQTGGETDLTNMLIIGSVNLNGGVLSGSGPIFGNLTNNSGFISPGHSAGKITVQGNFAQGPAGTLIIESSGQSARRLDQLQVTGAASLGGNLEIKLLQGYQPNPADTFNFLGFGSATGGFSSVSSNAQVTLNTNGALVSANPAVASPRDGQASNISTRLNVLAGDNVMIAGFVISGPAGSSKKVLIRGLGPTLGQFGVPNILTDPFLELHRADGSTVTNDSWRDNAAGIPAGYQPSSDLEPVIVADLPPGDYTAIVKGAQGETGNALAEVYDLETNSAAKLSNISTRGVVQTGDNVMIGGVVVSGTEPAKILVRALGPTLATFGVPDTLADPTLELHDSNGGVLSNDDWRENQEGDIMATGVAPPDSHEAALLVTLVPGNYTAVVRGKNETTGVALVEAYDVGQ